MSTVIAPSRARKTARPKFGPQILAALISGASVEHIAKTYGLPGKRVEKLLRDELQKRWIAPAQEYGRLQIVRLEGILAKLILKAEDGDLAAIDRILRVLDRLDRYHGFGKRAPIVHSYDDEARKRLFERLDRAAGRALLPPPETKA